MTPVELPKKPRFSVRETADIFEKHVSTIFRWSLKGVRGHRLRLVFIGAQRYVLREDLLDFLEAINGGAGAAEAATPAQRRREIEAAEKALAAAGIGTAKQQK